MLFFGNKKPFDLSLDRIGFEISGLQYDPARKLTRVQKFMKPQVDLSRAESSALLDKVFLEDDTGSVLLEQTNKITGNAEYVLNETANPASKSTKKNSYNYVPVPYNISLNVYAFTATAENGLQISIISFVIFFNSSSGKFFSLI
mgnify:CR=1 FL=1